MCPPFAAPALLGAGGLVRPPSEPPGGGHQKLEAPWLAGGRLEIGSAINNHAALALGLAFAFLPLLLPGPLQIHAGDSISQVPCRQDQLWG